MALGQQEQEGFNLGVQLYTQLLFDQKELITMIIDTAYAAGINHGIALAQAEIANRIEQAQVQEQEEMEVQQPVQQSEVKTENASTPNRVPNRFTK